VLALAAVVIAATVVAVVLLGSGGGDYTVHARFQNASQLVKGNLVQVAGVAIGKVDDITLSDDGQADVKFTITDDGYSPLRRGTLATVRQASLSGVANRYIDLRLPAGEPAEIPDGGTITTAATTSAVDLDELFDTLDPKTTNALRGVIRGYATAYGGRGKQANAGWMYLNPSLAASSRLFDELDRDTPMLRRFVDASARLVTDVAERRTDLAGLVDHLATTTGAIGRQKEALSSAIEQLPAFMRRANTTFVNLRATLDDLDVLVNESKPATKRLAPLFRKLRALVRDSRPTIRDLRVLIRKKGRNNDLIELTGKMPRLAQIAKSTFPHDIAALQKSLPVISYIRPYAPDLTGWITKFGQSANPYDANGHYARIQPIFNQFQYTDTPTGPTLTPLPDELAGRNGLNARNSLRCPGAATQPAPDGSNPWPDDAPGCDPTNVPPGP
jgi:phospholipid/cholesterol/gamma-HCH transport system substrate-binding protein